MCSDTKASTKRESAERTCPKSGAASATRTRSASCSAVGASSPPAVCTRRMQCSMTLIGGLAFPLSYRLTDDCFTSNNAAKSFWLRPLRAARMSSPTVLIDLICPHLKCSKCIYYITECIWCIYSTSPRVRQFTRHWSWRIPRDNFYAPFTRSTRCGWPRLGRPSVRIASGPRSSDGKLMARFCRDHLPGPMLSRCR